MENTCEVNVYWTVHEGRRRFISLTEQAALELLGELGEYAENPQGWSVEHSRELVPMARGQLEEGEGEIVELDEDGNVASKKSFIPVHIFWDCPWCDRQHSTDLYHGRFGRTLRYPNPSIWFCERGKGIVMVNW